MVAVLPRKTWRRTLEDIKRPEQVKLDLPLFSCPSAGIIMSLPSSMADFVPCDCYSCKRPIALNAQYNFKPAYLCLKVCRMC